MNNAGRIGFLIKGEYNNTDTYDFLDVVYYGGASYVAKKLTIGNIPTKESEYWQILAGSGSIADDGDISNTYVLFEESENRDNVTSGEKMSTFAGKIKKFFRDLKKVSFTGKYTDLEGIPVIPSLTNNLLSNQPGTALDAAQAPVLVGKIDAVDNKVAAINNTLKKVTGYVNTTVLENDYINADYLKNGNVVEVHFARNKVELKANTYLQEDCRPPRSIGTMIAVARQCVMGYLSISAQTGEVKVMFYSDLPVSSYTYYHFTFSCR